MTMKWHTTPPEVLVVGAGPVGIMTAIVLSKHDIPVRIIDQAGGPCSYSYALALHHRTLKLLQSFDLLEDVLKLAHPVERIHLHLDGGGEQKIDLNALRTDPHIPYLVTLPQASLENLLLEKLTEYSVNVNWSHRLAQLKLETDSASGLIERMEDRMTGYAFAHFESTVAAERRFQVPWIIGCDGWKSTCRERAGIGWITEGPDSEYAVFEFETKSAISNEMTVGLTDGLINVCWPLDSRHCRWSFELAHQSDEHKEREKEREMVQLGQYRFTCPEVSALAQYLRHRTPYWQNPPENLFWRMIVPFGRGVAEQFQEKRCLLLGDASHVTAPGGVQSMNSGILEAARVGELLAAVITGELPETSVSDLQAATQCAWEKRLNMGTDIHLKDASDHRLGGYLHKLFESLPASDEDLVKLSSVLGLQLPESSEQMLSG